MNEFHNHNGVKSHEDSMHNLLQGNSGGTTVTYNEDSDYRISQTRAMSVANKVNLDFGESVTRCAAAWCA